MSRLPSALIRPRCSSTASIIDTRDVSRPEVVRRGEGIWLSTVSACTSATSGRRPSRVTVRQVPGTGSARRVRNSPEGSASAGDALVVQLEAADLVGRPVAVLHAAHQAQPGVPVALELQHHVDQMLQQPRAGDRAVLGDVADQQRGHAALLGGADQRGRHLAHLGHPAGRAVHLGRGHRLHRVQHQQRGLHRVQVAEHGGQVRLGREIQLVVQRADAVGAQPHLPRPTPRP